MVDTLAHPLAMVSAHADPLASLGSGTDGGMNLAVRRLAEGLSALGIGCDVFTRRTADGQAPVAPLGSLGRVIRLDVGPRRRLAPADAAALADEFSAAALAHAAAEGREYSLVHGHHWTGGVAARQLADRWQVAWAQSFHTSAQIKRQVGIAVDPGREQIERELATGADRLVAMSRAEARALIEGYGADPRRVCVAHPGVDLDVDVDRAVVDQLRRDLGLENRRVVMYAGRLEPLKGTDTLLEALGCLFGGDGFDDVVALIAGGDAAVGERSRMEAIARDTGIAGEVHFIGTIDHDELAAHYALADVSVVPSRTESFGLAAAESLAAGTPVVAAAVGGLMEIVEDGVDGYLVDPDDVPGFCRRIGELLANDDLRRQFGERGREHARRFTWERASLRLASIYGQMERGEIGVPCPE